MRYSFHLVAFNFTPTIKSKNKSTLLGIDFCTSLDTILVIEMGNV